MSHSFIWDAAPPKFEAFARAHLADSTGPNSRRREGRERRATTRRAAESAPYRAGSKPVDS